MIEKEMMSCRGCRTMGQRGERRPFAIEGAAPHYAPDTLVHAKHIEFDLDLDPVKKTLKGEVTHIVTTVAPLITHIKMNQADLAIGTVLVNGKNTSVQIDEHELTLNVPTEFQKLPYGSELQIVIQYEVRKPRRGIYFTGPDTDYPKKPRQVWTQGQDEDSRYWFPTFDFPNQKMTTEMKVRVPKGYTAISNGALLAEKNEGDATFFHYKLGTPIVTYLITLVAGEFSKWEEKGPNGLPIQYFVEKGREADGKRAFGNTLKMVEVFSEKLGVSFPFEKYAQVAVQDFIFGGMENASATTQTDETLHDEKAHLDFTSDPLVSHELAHQWFGDLITCREWAHGWLNEGFATYMERVWIEHDSGPHGGWEEAKFSQYQDLKTYLDEDASSYRRPIVTNTYKEPIELFDRHLYQKGGLVLHLLRFTLGDEAFWRSLNHYLNRHKGGSVETIDLIRAIEDVTGRNMRQFFDEWVFGAGYPDLELNYSWNEENKWAEITVEQKQTGGKPSVSKDGATTHLFHLPAVFELTLQDGEVISKKIEISEAKERVFIPAPSKPKMFRFDPDFWIPKTIKLKVPKDLLVQQLKHDPDCMGRVLAAKELADKPEQDVLEALIESACSDSFWAVRAEAAISLAKMRSEPAKKGLLKAIEANRGKDSGSAKARRGIVMALGSLPEATFDPLLKELAAKDPSYFVEAEAITSRSSILIRTQLNALINLKDQKEKANEIQNWLIAQLKRDSYAGLIQRAAYRALSLLPGIGEGEWPEALQALFDGSKRGESKFARIGAIMGLGTVARVANNPVRARIVRHMNDLADYEDFTVRVMLIRALGASEVLEAIPVLQKIHTLDLDGRIRRDAWVTMGNLRAASTAPASLDRMQKQFEKMDKDQRDLFDRFDKFEALQKLAEERK